MKFEREREHAQGNKTKTIKPEDVRVSTGEELKRAMGQGAPRTSHRPIRQCAKQEAILTIKTGKLSTDVHLPPKLPPSASDRKDLAREYKNRRICLSVGRRGARRSTCQQF